jgi:hypothetical protein
MAKIRVLIVDDSAVIAILSEKIGAFLIYKFNVDIFLSAIIDVVLSTITKSRNK